MKYYIINNDYNDTTLIHDMLSRPKIAGYEDLNFDYDLKIAHEIPMIRFTRKKGNKGKMPDMLSTMLGGLVISEKFKTALDEAEIGNVDYYPAEIYDEATAEIYSGVYVANIIGKIACVDHERSEYSTLLAFPDKIRDFEEMHLDYGKLRGEKIFRLSENSQLILINEEVKRALDKADLKGVAFIPVEGFSND